MLELELPAYAATELYLACVEGMRDTTAALYQTGEDGIQLAEKEFFDTAAKGEFSSVVVDRCPSPEVTAPMMDQLYTRRLARRGTRARRYYDELRSATPNGVCPFCTHRQVATLDHYMPKSRFPDLAVTPANLVPACSDCNKAKSDQLPATDLEAVLHPYYDRLGGATWLGAEVIEAVPTGLRFFVSPDAAIDIDLLRRVERHFVLYQLAGLYAAQAATELVNIRYQLATLRSSADGVGQVRAWLGDMRRSCVEADPNGWRAAAYSAWTDSDWFCAFGTG